MLFTNPQNPVKLNGKGREKNLFKKSVNRNRKKKKCMKSRENGEKTFGG
jgi:hypothetical protein